MAINSPSQAPSATQPVSGTVTANAGTNLNTSLLALESGGNLATLVTNTNKIPSLGQALATSSVPIVLTASQLTTLTPPPTITGFALETGGNLDAIETDLDTLVAGITFASPQHIIADSGTITTVSAVTAITNALPAGSNIIGKVSQDTSPWVISGAITEAIIDAAIISQEATTSGIKGLTAFGAVTTNKSTYTTGKSDALSLDTSGLLRVSLADTPANTNKFLVTPDSVALPANQSVNVSQINGITPLMGNGTTGTGSQRVTIASDNTAFAVNATLSAETTKVIGTVNQGTSPWVENATLQTQTDTVMVGGVNIKEINGVIPLMGSGTMGTGSPRVTIASDNDALTVKQGTAANLLATVNIAAAQTLATVTTVSAVTAITNALPAGTNAIGDVNLKPAARGGWSVSSQTNLASTATVSSAAGKFGGYMFINLNSAPAYIQVFDTTSAVTLGTTTPTFVIPIPANATAANGIGANLEMSNGIAIANGIKVAATTTPTGASTIATGLTGFVLYV